MGISMQRLCAYLAMIAVVAGGIVGIVAIWTYVRLDIRAVRDDLSGRARERVLAEHRMRGVRLLDMSHDESRESGRGTNAATLACDKLGVGSLPGVPHVEDAPTTFSAASGFPALANAVDETQTTCDAVPAEQKASAVSKACEAFEVTREICVVHTDIVVDDGREG